MKGGFYTATKGRIYPPPPQFAKRKSAELCFKFELITLLFVVFAKCVVKIRPFLNFKIDLTF